MLTEREARLLIDEVERRYREDQERIETRRNHFHALPEADPVLPEAYKNSFKYQSDAPRQTHAKLKSRLNENHFMPEVRAPRNEPKANNRASRLEQVMSSGWIQKEERQGYTFQGALADGLIIDKYGVLHWIKADELLPKPNKDRLDKRDWDMARSGYPWHIEVLDPMGFMPVPDRSADNGFGLVVVRREVGLLDYKTAQGKAPLSLDRLGMGMEEDAPPEGSPSGSDWSERIKLYQIWDRGHWLEYRDIAKGRGAGVIENGGEHPYEMPPFSIAPGVQVNNPDPVLRYEPALTGIYRLKPMVDYYHSLLFATAEYSMLPYFYFESVDNGFPLADDAGNVMVFDRKAIGSAKVPPGYTLKKLDYEISQSFVNMGLSLMDQYGRAAPSTGQAEFDKNTQPWAIRLQQAQESVEPGEYLGNIARAINIAHRNQALVMSKSLDDGGFGEDISVFARYEDGNIDQTTVISISPDEIEGLDISIKMKNMSAAERITQIQVMKELLNDPKVPMTKRMFLVDAIGDPRPDDTIAAKDAEEVMDTIKPMLFQQEVRKYMGHVLNIGPDGMLVGPDGQTVDPVLGLAAAGLTPQAPAPGGGSPMAQSAQTQPQHPDLPNLSAPNTIPQQGMRG